MEYMVFIRKYNCDNFIIYDLEQNCSKVHFYYPLPPSLSFSHSFLSHDDVTRPMYDKFSTHHSK